MLQVFLGSNTLENQCYIYIGEIFASIKFRKTKFTIIKLLDLKYKSLEIRVLWFLKKALTSREEPVVSLSIVSSKARLHLALYSGVTRVILARSTVARSIHAMILYVVY